MRAGTAGERRAAEGFGGSAALTPDYRLNAPLGPPN
jgi:hypothetical protein